MDLWYEYASFSLGGIGVDPGAEDRVRLVFERALASVGLHCSQGSMIWDSYRIFEKSVNKPDKLEKIFRYIVWVGTPRHNSPIYDEYETQ